MEARLVARWSAARARLSLAREGLKAPPIGLPSDQARFVRNRPESLDRPSGRRELLRRRLETVACPESRGPRRPGSAHKGAYCRDGAPRSAGACWSPLARGNWLASLYRHGCRSGGSRGKGCRSLVTLAGMGGVRLTIQCHGSRYSFLGDGTWGNATAHGLPGRGVTLDLDARPSRERRSSPCHRSRAPATLPVPRRQSFLHLSCRSCATKRKRRLVQVCLGRPRPKW